MRLSHYTTVIPLTNDRALLMNHPRNILDFVSPELADAVGARKIETLPPVVQQQLLDRGYLTELTSEEEIAWLSSTVDSLEKEIGPEQGPKNYCFITSYRCNLACSYCFQSNENARIVTNRMLLMSEAKSGVAVIRNNLAKGGPGSEVRTPVLLFGGEPLLPNQREVVEYIVSECAEMGFPISATTNGMFLQHFEDLIGPAGIGHFQISLDGDALAHDRRRIPVNGAPTFDGIWANVRLALAKGALVELRCNIDKRNLSAFTALVEFVESEGYLEHPGLTVRYARVVPDFESRDGGSDVALNWSEIEKYLLEQAHDHPALTHVPAPSDVQTFQSWVTTNFPQKGSRHCGAVSGNMYFGPSGEIYNCHETTGRVELSIGRYSGGEVVYNDRAPKWHNRRADSLTTCKKCPFVLTCAGGCAAHVNLDNEPLKSNCENYAANFTTAVQRAYFSDGRPTVHDMQSRSC
jgi:uncharacterized protein